MNKPVKNFIVIFAIKVIIILTTVVLFSIGHKMDLYLQYLIVGIIAGIIVALQHHS